MSGTQNGRFQEQLEAFEHDRQAFRDVVAQLRSHGDAVLSHSDQVKNRTHNLVSDLEALKQDVQNLKDETYRKTRVTLERVESQRLQVEQMVASVADTLEALRSTTESDLQALHSATASGLEGLTTQARHDLEGIKHNAKTELEALMHEILSLRSTLEDRLAGIETKATDLADRLDVASETLLHGSADISDLISRSEALGQDISTARDKLERESRAASKVLSQVRSLSQLRWAVGLTAIGVGASLCTVSGALGLALGNPTLGWAIGAAEALPWLGIGVWVFRNTRSG